MQHYLEKELHQLIKNDPSVFEFLQSGSLDGLWYWDLENPEIEWMNHRFWELLGYDPAEKKHLVNEWQDIINPEDLNLAVDNFNKHCSDPNHSYDQIVRYKHKDGSTIWVRCRGVAIRDNNGKPVRMLGAHNDLTQLKNSEVELSETNKFLQLILDTSPDLVLVKDEQYRIVTGNKAFFNVYPKEMQDNIIGHTTLEKYKKEEADYFLRHDKIAFEDGFSRTKEQVTFPNSENKMLDTSKIRFENNDGKKFILGIAKDVTKEHQLVQDLEKKNTELRDARIQVEKLLNASETCTVFINDKFEIDSFTQTAERVLKLTKDDIGQKINGYLDTLNFDAIYDKLRQVLDTSVSFDTELLANNGSYYHLKLYGYLPNETQTTSIILSLVDITDYKNSIKLVRETQGLVELAAKHARIGIWNWEVDNDKLEWNDGMYDLFSIPKESFGSLYESFIEKVLPEDREAVNTKVNEALEEKTDFNTEYRIYGPNDSIKYIHAVGQYTPTTKNESGLLTGMCFDITALKQAEEELSKIALYDHVTGIPNRANFLSELPKSIARAKREKTIFAVFFIDLDNFKLVNDRYGHHSGDVLLKLVVERLLTVFRKEDSLARIGGDEFAAIIENIHSIDEIRLVAQRCIKAVAKEFNVLGNILNQYISVGVSIYPDSADKADKLLQCADTAMYRAKEKGKNNLAFFREELDQKMQRNSLIENALRQATVNNEFHLLYQPQYNAKQEIFGVEALLRWDNENIQNSNPDEFILIAEKTRQIIEIGQWVISQALRDMSVLNKKHPLLDIHLAINISSIQLFDPKFLKHLLSLLSNNGFNPKQLTLEITETHLMEDINKAKDALLALSQYGIKIALDDFGKGHSSLNYLANLPISYLKIDKGFVLNSDKNNNHIIMKSIISLANNLGTGCIAEGVETEEQYKYLLNNGCDKFQGFYFSKPITISSLCELIKQNTK